MHRIVRLPIALTLLVSVAACGGERAAPADTAAARDTGATGEAPRRIASVTGFSTPESVLWDSAGGFWLVSNIDGDPMAKDDNGFISRLRPDGTIDSLRFVSGGRGAPVHAPKGMAITGNELWVVDIDAVHVFDRTTGAHVAHVPLPAAVFPNDIAVGPDGAMYVTDSGLRFTASGMEHPGPDGIFRIDARTRAVSTAIQSPALTGPNGIKWDGANDRFVVVPMAGNAIQAWRPGERSTTTIATGTGQYDGVDITRDGRVLVSSWADSSVSVVTGAGTTTLFAGVPSPADIGVDRQANRVAVPSFTENRVEIWEIGTP